MRAGDWRPTAAWPVLARRAALLALARDWFAERNVTEVDTPALTAYGITDVNIESVRAHLGAAPGRDWYLHTSPEYPMKRLLAAGAPDIYQICHVFRDGENGRRHQPEFMMVEWYRHGFDLDAMVTDTLSFLRTLLEPSLGGLDTRTRRYVDTFRETTGIDPISAGEAAVREAAAEAGAGDYARTGDRDGCLDFLMAARVANAVGGERELVALTHYPASQAVLAALDPDDPRVALRFEVFLDGHELANGFVELRDAAEQRARFEADRAARRRRRAPDMRADERLLAALEHGLPPTAGVAVGFDRVVMAATGIDDIGRVQCFPVLSEEHEELTERMQSDTDRTRDVEGTMAAIRALLAGETDALAICANFVAALYQHLPRINWLGLYVLRGDELVLGPFQGKPACVRIRLGQGVCGTAAQRRQTLCVPDVHAFEGHIACDPDSRSEVVVPLIIADRVWGVLDVDSPHTGRFETVDVELIERAASLLTESLGETAAPL
ncbi:MAG: EF-P lysine aminoacylase EpmA [Gammaproteobacteria bacterium]|jgi:lysyl-tRNA synthetase class 2